MSLPASRPHSILSSLALSAAALALTACGGAADDAAQNSAQDEEFVQPDEPGMVDNMLGGEGKVALTEQFAHPTGLVVQLTSLEIKPAETVLGVNVTNGTDNEIDLNPNPRLNKSFIVSGDGQKFALSPPAANKEVTIQPGGKMQGELVFLGAIPTGESATLVLNESGSDSDSTRYPGIRMNIPLDGL